LRVLARRDAHPAGPPIEHKEPCDEIREAPPAAQASPAATGESGAGAVQAAAHALNRTRRLLVAEDNLINQKIITRQLARLGYRADLVGNGRAAVDAVQRASYDLVLMDCQMPELDGYQAAAAIRRLGGLIGRIPIIAMTA